MTVRSFVERLRGLAELNERDVETIQAMPSSSITVKRARDILSTGETPDYVYVIESGWAARYGVRSNGSRRITGFMIPGDFCGIHAVSGEAMDHAIVALTQCEIVRIGKFAIERAISASPAISRALWRAKLGDEAILRAWLLQSQDAAQSLAHLLCELYARSNAIGAVHEGRFEAPLTQEHIGDALGLTAVHINRRVRLLREKGLATVGSGEVVVHDIEALQRYCAFSAAYLHLPATPPQPGFRTAA